MKRNFILPSEGLNYVQHDCRLENLKYRFRNGIYDVSVLSTLLNKTANSLNSLYSNYLSQPEDLSKIDPDLFKSQLQTNRTDITNNSNNTHSNLNKNKNQKNKTDKDNHTVISNTTSNSESNDPNASKVIKETRINANSTSYGNILWPGSIVSTYSEDIICADTLEHRLIVFNKELLFKYQIGCKGYGNGEFNVPIDLVISELGRLYVADKENSRVQIFTEARKVKEHRITGASSIMTTASSKIETKSKIFRTGTEFVFSRLVKFNDKPVKLTAAPLSPIVAVGTETGYIYILNETNQIINFLKLNSSNFNLNDLKNICFNENGNELICMKKSDNNFFLKFYKVENPDDEENENSENNKLDSLYIKKVEMIRKVKLEKNYLPGICLIKSNCIRLSLDMKNLLVFDSINLTILEYDLKGKFNKIILKAENYLSNVLSFDFTGDRQHLVTCEAELNRKSGLLDSRSSFRGDDYLSKHDLDFRYRSRTYMFKIKVYRYRDCDCHRPLVSRSRLTMFNRSIGFNQSFNNFSLDSDSGDFMF